MATEVARGRTALHRTALSRPVARAVEDGLISERTSVFDYGCGRGGDIARLKKLGVDVAGFDPTHFPGSELRKSHVVNLGYVVNVIEDERERADVLRVAYELSDQLLVVSARLAGEERRLELAQGHGDGLVTGLGTFQRFFTQGDLRAWIDATLDARSIAAEPGIFYVFRNVAEGEAFLLTRVRRSRSRVRRSDVVFENHQELLAELIEFVEEQGRIPRTGEFTRERELREKVGTPRQAFQVIKAITGEERWDRARVARYEDLLVYLALSRFRRRPKLSDLPIALQYDIKDFFGSYKAGCEAADRALFAIAEQTRVAEAIRYSAVGKRMPSALYVHASALGRLPPVLRVLEGCARELLGTVTDAALVKIDVERPRVAYMQYPDFDDEAHPALKGVYFAALDSLRTDFIDYASRDNPPILHRKERFVSAEYPFHERFSRLTKQEERAGLYRDPSRIGTASGWNEALIRAGVQIRGHRLHRLQ